MAGKAFYVLAALLDKVGAEAKLMASIILPVSHFFSVKKELGKNCEFKFFCKNLSSAAMLVHVALVETLQAQSWPGPNQPNGACILFSASLCIALLFFFYYFRLAFEIVAKQRNISALDVEAGLHLSDPFSAWDSQAKTRTVQEVYLAVFFLNKRSIWLNEL